MPLQTSPSLLAMMNTDTSSPNPLMTHASSRSSADQCQYSKAANDKLTTKDKLAENKNNGRMSTIEKSTKKSMSDHSRTKVSGKSETKSSKQNHKIKDESQDLTDPSNMERPNSSSSLQYDCGDVTEMEEICSSKESRYECLTAREIEKHIKSLTEKISANRTTRQESDLTRKQGPLFDKHRLSRQEPECTSNWSNLVDTVESRKKTYKAKTGRFSDESKSKATLQKYSRSSRKARSSTPKHDAYQDQLQDTAKRIINAAQQRADIDSDAVMDLISLLNPEVGDIVMQMQLETKRKEQEVKKEKEIKSKLAKHMMNCNVEELRMILLASKEKYDNLKAKAVRMRTQYILKSNRLKQMQRNMRILIDRYKEFKKLHDDCEDQRQNLRNQLFQAVKDNEESDQLVQEFNETRMVYADRIKFLQEENQKLKTDIKEVCDANRRNETIDRELQQSLDSKIELLESVKLEMKKKDEVIQRLQTEVQVSCNETKAILEQSKRFHEEIGSLRTSLKQKELEASEGKLKVKMQEKTIKHLQLAYNLLLTDHDISSKSSVDKKCKIAGDNQLRNQSSKDTTRSSIHQNVSHNTEEISVKQNMLSEASDLISARKSVYSILSKHCNMEENRVEDQISQLLGDRSMPQQSNGRPDVKEESFLGNKDFSKSNSSAEIPEEQLMPANSTLNNSHSHKTVNQSMNALNFDDNLKEVASTNLEHNYLTKTINQNTNHSVSNYLKSLFNVDSIKSKLADNRHGKDEDNLKLGSSTVLVDLTDGSLTSQKSTTSDLSKPSTPKSKDRRDRDTGNSESTNHRRLGTPRMSYTDRSSGLPKKLNRRSNSVPKHVTFVGTQEKNTDRGDLTVRSWCGSPTTTDVQSEGAHPLLCRRQIGKARNNLNQTNHHELGTMQRTLDSLNDLVQNKELNIQQIRERVASVISFSNAYALNDSTIQILSLLFDSGKPVPTLHES